MKKFIFLSLIIVSLVGCKTTALTPAEQSIATFLGKLVCVAEESQKVLQNIDQNDPESEVKLKEFQDELTAKQAELEKEASAIGIDIRNPDFSSLQKEDPESQELVKTAIAQSAKKECNVSDDSEFLQDLYTSLFTAPPATSVPVAPTIAPATPS